MTSATTTRGTLKTGKSPTDFTDLHRLLGCAFKGVHLSPLGFAACQSKKCTNQSSSAPTNQAVVLPQISDKTNTNLSNRTNTGLPTFVLSE